MQGVLFAGRNFFEVLYPLHKYTVLPSKYTAQECDATGDAICTNIGYIKNILALIHSILRQYSIVQL